MSYESETPKTTLEHQSRGQTFSRESCNVRKMEQEEISIETFWLALS